MRTNCTRAASNAKVKNVYGFKASKLTIRDKVSANFVRLKKNWNLIDDANTIRTVGAKLFHADTVLRNR
jgi:hypothetical protein